MADLDALYEQLAEQAGPAPSRPLEQWHPDLSGDMDLVIQRGGRWLHEGSPIQREALIDLFASILRREEDGHYYLVTPVEKWRIQVEDVPLLAVQVARKGRGREQQLLFATDHRGQVALDADHPLRVEDPETEPRPYLYVAHGLEARLTRNVFYQLADWAETTSEAPGELGVWSHGQFYSLGPAP